MLIFFYLVLGISSQEVSFVIKQGQYIRSKYLTFADYNQYYGQHYNLSKIKLFPDTLLIIFTTDFILIYTIFHI